MNRILSAFFIFLIEATYGQGWSNWTECDAFCGKGKEFRFLLNEQGQYTEEKPEIRECEADDLKCALSSGIPAVVGLIIILVIYTMCRKRSEGNNLSRGKERLQNYRSALGTNLQRDSV